MVAACYGINYRKFVKGQSRVVSLCFQHHAEGAGRRGPGWRIGRSRRPSPGPPATRARTCPKKKCARAQHTCQPACPKRCARRCARVAHVRIRLNASTTHRRARLCCRIARAQRWSPRLSLDRSRPRAGGMRRTHVLASTCSKPRSKVNTRRRLFKKYRTHAFQKYA